MRSVIVLCIGVSLLGFAGVASAGQSGGTHAVTLQPTVVSLVQGTNNTVQLGLMIDGQFSYPFTFKADPPPDNGIALDSVGVLSGTPQKIADQNVTVRVTDSTGKSVAAYPLVIHVTNRLMVMLGTSETGAAPSPAGTPASDPAPQATGKSQPPSPTFVLESMYTGGDTITGHLLPKAAPSDPSGPGNQKNLAGKPAAQAPAGGPNADPPPASLPTPENPAGAKPGNADPPGENQAAPAKVDAKANFEADTFTVSCTPRVPPGER